MTTHSPYLINYLTHAVKAYNVLEKKKLMLWNNASELETRLNQIVPLNAVLNPNDWVIYELDGINRLHNTFRKLQRSARR